MAQPHNVRASLLKAEGGNLVEYFAVTYADASLVLNVESHSFADALRNAADEIYANTAPIF